MTQMKKMALIIITLPLCLCVFIALPLAAWGTTFYSYTEPIADLIDSPTTITFNSYNLGLYTSITESGVTITSPNKGYVTVTGAYIDADSQYKYADTHYLGYSNYDYTISFSEPVSQFGMGFFDINNPNNPSPTLTAYGTGNVVLETFTLPTDSFVTSYFAGFKRSQADIIRIEFTPNTGDSVGIDNVTFSRVTPVPLPPAVWLLGSGLLGLAGWRRWRKD
jgi:hypothetical protein